jgi:hypothetical protein
MIGRAFLFLLVLLAPCRLLADSVPAPPGVGDQACRQAILAAERSYHIPSHLLAAIARVESGRRDPVSGAFNPWPWTINMDGQGSFYDNKAQAVQAATAMRAHATTSIDVGCMQISLMFHPDAFADMNQAFDPVANADYGARFLVQLYEKTNSWPKAVEMYHSATPEIGQDYGRRVYAAWPEEQRLAEAVEPYPAASTWTSPFARAPLFMALRQGAPHIIPQVAALGGGPPQGRSLESYRLNPVRLAYRMP